MQERILQTFLKAEQQLFSEIQEQTGLRSNHLAYHLKKTCRRKRS
ncbi:MAG: hypothetical protein ACMXYD_01280 [Candidatus Woesearchaeota archaeon]